ncbi:hypothetical protein V9T40_006423 [Parthenolecanium corni]|uniref:Uncharacterized protein n=1 Tax=Parthenolecanium corni TaxID=536013 RepID=A0AAN9Y7D9_9HEMI
MHAGIPSSLYASRTPHIVHDNFKDTEAAAASAAAAGKACKQAQKVQRRWTQDEVFGGGTHFLRFLTKIDRRKFSRCVDHDDTVMVDCMRGGDAIMTSKSMQ